MKCTILYVLKYVYSMKMMNIVSTEELISGQSKKEMEILKIE